MHFARRGEQPCRSNQCECIKPRIRQFRISYTIYRPTGSAATGVPGLPASYRPAGRLHALQRALCRGCPSRLSVSAWRCESSEENRFAPLKKSAGSWRFPDIDSCVGGSSDILKRIFEAAVHAFLIVHRVRHVLCPALRACCGITPRCWSRRMVCYSSKRWNRGSDTVRRCGADNTPATAFAGARACPAVRHRPPRLGAGSRHRGVGSRRRRCRSTPG